jgi:hypothetical protein
MDLASRDLSLDLRRPSADPSLHPNALIYERYGLFDKSLLA